MSNDVDGVHHGREHLHARWAEKERWTGQRFAEAARARGEHRRRIEDEIAVAHLDLVDTLASRIVGASREIRDVRQVGCVGLVKAVRRFEPDRGVPFVPYAVPTIGGEIKRHLRDNGWFVRPPRSVQELRAEALRATTELGQCIGREPTMAELATHLGRTVADVVQALAAHSSLRPASLDAPVAADDATPFGQTIPIDDDSFDRVDLALTLRAAVSTLDGRDQRVLELRFVHHRTQSEIADEIGVTQMQVSRILSRVLATLRGRLDGLDPAIAGAA
ncbi:sigma-70 family RNA polymerase sigma factor [Labedella populi]|uniref:sigma-70 family RNA polymerase sigma factor n=1 Tax=Labedella populi TaxID=2498850 RepID=UPI00140905E9|nr:sigma-70 family RNA polymerase sigma factor [Labedella populi]